LIADWWNSFLDCQLTNWHDREKGVHSCEELSEAFCQRRFGVEKVNDIRQQRYFGASTKIVKPWNQSYKMPKSIGAVM